MDRFSLKDFFKCNIYYVFMLFGYAFAVLFRSPQLILHPRFWCEEGRNYFCFAWNHPWFQALFHPHLGYYSFLANGSGILATLVPLEYAPLVTTCISFLVHLIPAILILINTSPAFEGYFRKGAALLILGFTVPSAEVWLNTITSQFHLLLAAILILINPYQKRYIQIFYTFILLLAGLSTPILLFILPVFLFKALRDHSGIRAYHTALLVGCGLVQFIVMHNNSAPGTRFPQFEYSHFLFTMLCKNICLPMLGMDFTDRFGKTLAFYLEQGYTPIPVKVIFSWFFLFLSYVFYRSRVSESRWLFFIAIYLDLLFYIFALGESRNEFVTLVLFGGRYFYVSNVLLLLSLLSLLSKESLYLGHRILIWIFLGILIVFNMNSCLFINGYNNSFLQGDTWTDEVHQWRQNPDYPLKIWMSGWEIHLSAPSETT